MHFHYAILKTNQFNKTNACQPLMISNFFFCFIAAEPSGRRRVRMRRWGVGGATRALLGLQLLLVVVTARGSPNAIVKQFHDPEVERMNHLVVDKNTGRVYVGAVNRLYQLSPDLDLVVKEITGPKPDSPECSTMDCPAESTRKLLDNVNKALVLDYTTTRLISCGSLFQVFVIYYRYNLRASNSFFSLSNDRLH